MKLPGIAQRTGVQSLGRESVGLPARQFEAEAEQTRAITGSVDEVAQSYIIYDDHRANMQKDQANQNLVNRDAQWRQEHEGRDFYEANELPPEILGDDQRERIPAYEVQHELYNASMQSWIEEESVGIARKKDREAWAADKDLVRVDHYAKAVGKAREKQIEFDRKRQEANYEDAIQQGQWGRAISIGENYPGDDVEREALIKGARTEQELDGYRESMRLEDVQSMQEHIEFLNDSGYAGQLDSNQRLQIVNSLQREINSINTRGQAGLKAQRALWKDDLKNTTEFLMEGNILPIEALQEISAKAEALGKPEDADELRAFNQAIEFSYQANEFQAQPESARAAQLKSMKAGINTPEKIAQYNAFLGAHEAARRQVDSDMMVFAENTGVAKRTPLVPDFNPVPGTTVSPFMISLEERMTEYTRAASVYGFGQGPLKKQEASVIAGMIEQAAPEQQFAIMREIHALGDQADIVFNQLNTEMPGAWTHAAGMFGNGNITAARQVIDGGAMRKADPKLIGETKQNLYTDMTDLSGPIYGLDVSARSAFQESVLDMYAYIATTEGLEPGAYDRDVLERAVEKVTGGGLIEYNDYRLVPPAYGLGQNAFEDWADNISPAHVGALGGVIGLSNEDVRDVIRDGDYRLVNVGADAFALQYNGDGETTGTFLMNKTTGEPFILRYTPAASVSAS